MAEQKIPGEPQIQPEGVAASFLRVSGLVDHFQDIARQQNKRGLSTDGIDSGALVSYRNHGQVHLSPFAPDLQSRVTLSDEGLTSFLSFRYNGNEDADSSRSITHFDSIDVQIDPRGIHVTTSRIVESHFADSVDERRRLKDSKIPIVIEQRDLSRDISPDEFREQVLGMMEEPDLPDGEAA